MRGSRLFLSGAASSVVCLTGVAACRSPEPAQVASVVAEPPVEPAQPDQRESHFTSLEQLTFGGENAEAYWAFDGSQLIFQAHREAEGCDQIYTMPSTGQANGIGAVPRMVSTGAGVTTCAYFMPKGERIIYASTHLADQACPAKPDRSQGYVWALYKDYDIFRAKTDGSEPERLTATPGYDAEATVCARDGSIVFTSVRDGDLELYRMNADGSDVVRLTQTPGYDGGAFFNHDCSKIVWRASRPEGDALADYQRLLGQGLVRPSKLELYVAEVDGSEARQITYLNAAAFAPYWHPSGRRILFSTNFADPKGREFDIWAIDIDGTDLERITFAPGFDGFPMFSPDGKRLAFSSNRASKPGTYDTNVFVANWQESAPAAAAETGADRVQRDIDWLAAPEREGRGVGTEGLAAAGAYIERRMQELGLEPAGEANTFRQHFQVTTSVTVHPDTKLAIAGEPVPAADFQPLSYSAEGAVSGALALAGYGISDKSLGVDDYAGLDVKGKVVVVRRFVPEAPAFESTQAKRRYGDLHYKAWTARERGAKGLIIVDAPLPPEKAAPDWQAPPEAAFPSLHRDSYGDAGIPILIAKREVMRPSLTKLAKTRRVSAELVVKLQMKDEPAFNVLGRLRSTVPAAERLPGEIVIGAHYDHLGMGGLNSLAPEEHTAHVGADDNASGVAAVLEAARLAKVASESKRDLVFVTFSGEERGLLGSSHLTRKPPSGFDLKNIYAMFNLDMVGRLRENHLTVLGVKTADEWPPLLQAACEATRLRCNGSGDGYGPSDQTAFYAAGIPVLHFFTGAHADYHKPSDTADRINATGAAQIAALVTGLARETATRPAPLTFQKIAPEEPRGDLRSFNASLGTIPDYAGPKSGEGVLLANVRPGSAAEQGGMQRGDVLIRLGSREIKSVHDLMYVLNASKPGETVSAVVLRGAKPIELKVTFQESKGRR